jgi:hypothetical protein
LSKSSTGVVVTITPKNFFNFEKETRAQSRNP